MAFLLLYQERGLIYNQETSEMKGKSKLKFD